MKGLEISIKVKMGLGGYLRKMANLDIFLIDYEIYKANPKWWLEIFDIFLKSGLRFKASFERNRTYILDILSNYDNDLKITIEKNIIYLEGIFNRKMINYFKANYKVVNGVGIDYYSPFLTLEIGKNYCSAHYGNELYLTDLSMDEFDKAMKIINPLREYFKIDII